MGRGCDITDSRASVELNQGTGRLGCGRNLKTFNGSVFGEKQLYVSVQAGNQVNALGI